MAARLRRDFRRYVSSFRILEERFRGQGRSGTYWVRVQVTVDELALAKLADTMWVANQKERPACVRASGPQATLPAPFLRGLTAGGVRFPCPKGTPGIEVGVSCRVTERLQPSHGQAAAVTIGCKALLGTSQRKTVTAMATGLGTTAPEARQRAWNLALVRLGRRTARTLRSRRSCSFTWTLRLHGPTNGLLAVTARLTRRFGPRALLGLVLRGDSARVRLLAPRCFVDGRRLLDGAVPREFAFRLTEKPGELEVVLLPAATSDHAENP